MLITRVSMFTGIERTLNINVTKEQLDNYYDNNMLVQAAFPNLSTEDREFIKTGVTNSEWKKYIGECDG